MKIKEILVESFKSPAFNILAIVNLAVITLTATASLPFLITNPVSKLAILVNLPAFVAARILVSRTTEAFAFIPPFIYLQWIFIGALAKLIASQWKPKTD